MTERIGWNAHLTYHTESDEESLYLVSRDANGRRHILNIEPSGAMLFKAMDGQVVAPTMRGNDIRAMIAALSEALKQYGIDPDAERAALKARLTDSQTLSDRLLGHILTEDSKRRT